MKKQNLNLKGPKNLWSMQEQAHLLTIFEKNEDAGAAMRIAARQFKRSEGSVYQKYKRIQNNKAVLLYKDKYFDKNNISERTTQVKENLIRVESKKQITPENNLQKVMTLELKKIGTVEEQDYFLDKNNNVIIIKIVG
jgi:hypothetical protein